MRLSECKPGGGGSIKEIHGTGPLTQRLMELGLIEGTVVKVVRVAPLGDPIEVEVHNYHLSLRKTEAEGVELDA